LSIGVSVIVLTAEDKQLVHRAFMQGPSVLLEDGMTTAQAQDFLRRADVREEIEVLTKEFDHQEVLFALTKFGVKRRLARLAPGAAAILAEALAGPTYARDKEGAVRRDASGRPMLLTPEVRATQMQAASEILDRLDIIGGKRLTDRSMGINVDLLLRQVEEVRVTISDDSGLKTEEERALARERVRTAIDRLTSKLPVARERAREQLGLPAPGSNGKTKNRKARKRGKKKAVKEA
jgi:hypothetical protein